MPETRNTGKVKINKVIDQSINWTGKTLMNQSNNNVTRFNPNQIINDS